MVLQNNSQVLKSDEIHHQMISQKKMNLYDFCKNVILNKNSRKKSQGFIK